MSVLIIAEAGVNHNGNIDLAKEMIIKAKEAGADYIKFQTFIPKQLVSASAQKAGYQKETTGSDESQLEMLAKLALTFEDFKKLQEECKKVGIGFVSTPFDLESIDFLTTLNMPFWKIPSGEITNEPYLRAIGKTHMPVIMSTGMSTVEEIREALQVLREEGCEDIRLLHCNTQYPTPMEDVNLAAMDTLRKEFQVPVGFSDHTMGIYVPIGAVARGAEVIEKHFTLDHSMEGPDHKASLEPDELKEMIACIRQVERAIGSGRKEPSPSEKTNMVAVRKSIVAAKEIKKGEIFTEDNLTTKRPGDGMSPMKWSLIIGKKADKDYHVEDKIDGFVL